MGGKMRKFFFCLVSSLFFCLSINAQSIYYVSSSGGNNSNTGTSTTSPWKTLSKLNSFTFKAGDKIYFRKGDIWREQLNINSSGTSSSRIEFNTFGTGNNPVISGADLLTGFTLYSGSVWRRSLSSKPQQVFFNHIRGKEETLLAAVTTAGEWYYNSS